MAELYAATLMNRGFLIKGFKVNNVHKYVARRHPMLPKFKKALNIKVLSISMGMVLLAGMAYVESAFAQVVSQQPRWPTNRITLVVPAPPGSSGDILARILADKLSPIWRQPVIIDNRPGAGGLIGMRLTAAAAPDGLTLVLTATSAAIITPHVYRSAKYDVEKDFSVISVVGYTPMAIAASFNSTDKNLSDMINASRQNPDKLAVGHPGHATMAHLSTELLNHEAGGKFYPVNMGGAANGLKGVISNEITYYIDGLTSLMPMIRGNKVKAVTVFSDKVPEGLENVTLAKDFVPGMVMHGWFALLGPAGMSRAVTQKINDDVNNVLKQPEVVTRLKSFSTYTQLGSVEEATAYIRSEKQRWNSVLKKANIEAQ
jgi:tripartite-type tricarboxylate transporter receptor subunit TctC